jgi:iron-sulfur cluster assembly protein
MGFAPLCTTYRELDRPQCRKIYKNVKIQRGNKVPITLTPRAAAELKDLLVAQEKSEAALRVWVAGGGCSGLSYGMAIDDAAPEEGDQVFEHEGIKIYIDDLSLNYMDGSSVDYVEDVLGGGFKIENPNATSSCGCGSSFKTEGAEGAAGGGCGSCGCR